MKLFRNKEELLKEIKTIKNINFVPTMGSLHKGHESLIKKSVKNSKNTIVSIFINPKQFENIYDFKKYPKNRKNDIRILKRLRVKYVYYPTYNDIFKFRTKNKIYLDNFSKKLCGKYRKGHFKGVIDVVNRFIEIITPNKIFLGMKDFQQLVLIKKHINKNGINIKIIRCKTIRDSNFIAYSSRLKKLKKHEKNKLFKIIRYLKNYKKNLILKRIDFNLTQIKKKLLLLGANKVDYIEQINMNNLKKTKKGKFNLFFAFYVGKIRFIDNF
tara:strand:- start:7349 stop:8158 length:810 start_codon:yes stop_codon:yes gene_type:complete